MSYFSPCDTISTMNFSTITNDLLIGTTPSSQDYNVLRELGVKLAINMRVEYRPRKDEHESPLQLLWLPTFDTPLVPISIRYLQRGAKAALETIQSAGKVYAHCAGGSPPWSGNGRSNPDRSGIQRQIRNALDQVTKNDCRSLCFLYPQPYFKICKSMEWKQQMICKA